VYSRRHHLPVLRHLYAVPLAVCFDFTQVIRFYEVDKGGISFLYEVIHSFSLPTVSATRTMRPHLAIQLSIPMQPNIYRPNVRHPSTVRLVPDKSCKIHYHLLRLVSVVSPSLESTPA